MEITTRPRLAPCGNERPTVKDGLERAFLGEMLKYAGPKPLSGSFGGGIGEEQFASLLSDVNAESLARRLDMKLMPEKGGESCRHVRL